MHSIHLEQDLYEPVRQFWTAAGYTVRGEVVDCDVIAQRDDGAEWVAIELKRTLNLEVIIQATQRQRLCADVWIAVARPDRSLRTRRWQHLVHLLRRLELGLLLVDPDRSSQPVEVIVTPESFSRVQSLAHNKKRQELMRREFRNRHGDNNTGGQNRTPLMTVYREQSLLIAALLQQQGPAKAAQLRRSGGPANTYTSLYKNYYRWFEKCGPGLYTLSVDGAAALRQYDALAAHLLAELARNQNSQPTPD